MPPSASRAFQLPTSLLPARILKQQAALEVSQGTQDQDEVLHSTLSSGQNAALAALMASTLLLAQADQGHEADDTSTTADDLPA